MYIAGRWLRFSDMDFDFLRHSFRCQDGSVLVNNTCGKKTIICNIISVLAILLQLLKNCETVATISGGEKTVSNVLVEGNAVNYIICSVLPTGDVLQCGDTAVSELSYKHVPAAARTVVVSGVSGEDQHIHSTRQEPAGMSL